jgi:thiamine pyrophosphate-dependent acetolactate synthase large subunit-like protein
MKDKVGDFLVKRLSQWGVKRIYGFPGDGINGIMGALDRAGDLLDFVQVRHEEMAACTRFNTLARVASSQNACCFNVLKPG